MPTDTQLTEIIIGAAYTVFNSLKPGLDEKLYERALVIEPTKQGLFCDPQKRFPVHYDSQLIGTLIPDLMVEDRIIVDAKIVTGFNNTHLASQTASQPHSARPLVLGRGSRQE